MLYSFIPHRSANSRQLHQEFTHATCVTVFLQLFRKYENILVKYSK